ncbi:translocation/assembly module TamB domain-containing protein [Alteromonas sp. CYL-A6]|uniref:translocation/assembly module TamB domain-containing protein n=1 Tax=Alteromonas nitratireducens TaxID=3390813 RepID=UPI0034A79D00
MRKRILSLWVVFPFILVTLLVGLLFTPLGTPALRFAAVKLIPGLTINDVSGSLAHDLTVHGVHWQQDRLTVNAERASVNISWRCLVASRVCLEKVHLDGVSVTQKAGDDAPEETPADDTLITLPVPVIVDDVRLSNLAVTLPEQTITLAQATLSANAYKHIYLLSPRLKGLDITLPASQSPRTEAALPNRYALSYTAPKLPAVSVPLALTIKDFLLENSVLNQGTESQSLARLAFTEFSTKRSAFEINGLDVVHAQGELSGSASLSLQDNYPLSARLQARADVDNISQTLSLDADGALDDLTLSLRGEGIAALQAGIHVNLLDDSLPLTVSAEWPSQSLYGVAQGRLDPGTLNLSGQMGDYLLTLDGGASLPDIGDVPVAGQVTLHRNAIEVNSLTARILQGEITNHGTLYLNERISWTGRTELAGITGTAFHTLAPTDLKGGFTSIMQLTDKGPDVSVTDMEISGMLQSVPLSVKGALVYSQPSNIVVGNLTLEQSTNRIIVAGQVFNQRYLNADIRTSVNDAALLYPGISGQTSGTIKVTGPWQNPTAKGTLTLSDLAVDETVSQELAAQGPLNGSLDIAGTLEQHTLNTTLTLPQYQATLTAEGNFTSPRWQGTVRNTHLVVQNTQWSQVAPFALSLNSQTGAARAEAHCWLSRREGELCIQDLTYTGKRADWDIEARQLPVGLWARERLPGQIAAASDATLTLRSQGAYEAGKPVSASFQAQLTPAAWSVGNTTPITVNLDDVSVTGTFKNNTLDATSRIHSPELGLATVRLVTAPLAEQGDINGHIRLTDIDVAPLKPLSPAIRELSGTLNGDLRFAYQQGKPSLFGQLRVENGAADIKDTPLALGDWHQTLLFNDRHATFDGAFKLGGGDGTLSGSANWADSPEVMLKLKGKRFEVRQPNMRFQVSPDLEVQASQEALIATGSIGVPWARIEIEQLPESAVSPSKDVHLRGEPPPQDPLDKVNAAILVNIDKNKHGEVRLTAFGLKANLHGGIHVNTQPALVGYGDLQIMDGTYAAYGQNLVIKTGEVQFNGPLDQPFLLVEAVRAPEKTDNGVIAGIRIEGPADYPSVNLFSEPAMDQQAVLSYLLTGKGPNSDTQAPNYEAILLGFGLSNTKSLTGQVGDALGIDDFTLSTNESRLSVSGQINERLSVQYNVDVGLSNNDATSRNLRRRQEPPDLAVRYKLLPKLFLEAVQTTIEDQSEFAIDLYYEFFLGKPREQAAADDDD